METFLILNGLEIDAPVEEQEKVILGVASGVLQREDWVRWLVSHVVELKK